MMKILVVAGALLVLSAASSFAAKGHAVDARPSGSLWWSPSTMGINFEEL
jgi:hypothetical protein